MICVDLQTTLETRGRLNFEHFNSVSIFGMTVLKCPADRVRVWKGYTIYMLVDNPGHTSP